MTEENHTLHICIADKHHSWLQAKAVQLGLPSPENYVLLLIRMAWQKEQLTRLENNSESELDSRT